MIVLSKPVHAVKPTRKEKTPAEQPTFAPRYQRQRQPPTAVYPEVTVERNQNVDCPKPYDGTLTARAVSARREENVCKGAYKEKKVGGLSGSGRYMWLGEGRGLRSNGEG